MKVESTMVNSIYVAFMQSTSRLVELKIKELRITTSTEYGMEVDSFPER